MKISEIGSVFDDNTTAQALGITPKERDTTPAPKTGMKYQDPRHPGVTYTVGGPAERQPWWTNPVLWVVGIGFFAWWVGRNSKR